MNCIQSNPFLLCLDLSKSARKETQEVGTATSAAHKEYATAHRAFALGSHLYACLDARSQNLSIECDLLDTNHSWNEEKALVEEVTPFEERKSKPVQVCALQRLAFNAVLADIQYIMKYAKSEDWLESCRSVMEKLPTQLLEQLCLVLQRTAADADVKPKRIFRLLSAFSEKNVSLDFSNMCELLSDDFVDEHLLPPMRVNHAHNEGADAGAPTFASWEDALNYREPAFYVAKLRWLSLSGSGVRLKRSMPALLTHFGATLTHLDVSHTRVSRRAAPRFDLPMLPSLVSLNVSYSDFALTYECAPRLLVLRAHNYRSRSKAMAHGDSLRHVRHLTRLRILDLSETPSLCSATIIGILRDCRRLQWLFLDQSALIDRFFVQIAEAVRGASLSFISAQHNFLSATFASKWLEDNYLKGVVQLLV